MNTAITPNWIARFTAAHGRPPRILHMGNVCNNAYQTAKMLNAAGADCDVFSADDYYVMANPEWDDAEITGDVGNLYYPMLHRVNLHGYQRPRWFAHGPIPLTLAYLIAKREGRQRVANRQWRNLAHARRRISEQQNQTPYGNFSLKWEGFRRYVSTFASTRLDYIAQVLKEIFTRPGTFMKRVRMNLGRLPDNEATALRTADLAAQNTRRKAMIDKVVDADVLRRVLHDAKTLFPERGIQFDSQLESFMLHLKEFRQLFAFYDVIQAYDIQAVWPYLAGVNGYMAYEHGELRSYIYEENDLCRLTLLAFAQAKTVYVTNLDCFDSAQYLTQKTGGKIVCGLHGIDVERIIQNINLAPAETSFDARFGSPRGTPLFFSPSRHTWLEEEKLYLKGDDKLVRAAARLAAEGHLFRLVLLSWGDDIRRLKTLIGDYPQLQHVIQWHAPLGKNEFYAVLQQADAILDQFHLHAYGGIFIEALSANAAPLITCSVEPARLARFFSTPPPYLPADSENDIYHAMKQTLEKPDEARALATTGRNWVQNHHSHARIVQKCCEGYQHLLPL